MICWHFKTTRSLAAHLCSSYCGSYSLLFVLISVHIQAIDDYPVIQKHTFIKRRLQDYWNRNNIIPWEKLKPWIIIKDLALNMFIRRRDF